MSVGASNGRIEPMRPRSQSGGLWLSELGHDGKVMSQVLRKGDLHWS
jgi:hypothetical protein